MVRQRHEVAGSRAGVAWDEQPARGLKNRDAHYVTDAKRDPPRQWCTGLRCVGPASSFCRSVIFAAALVYKTRISRSRESEDYSDSSCGGEDNGARPDHHGNNSSTRGLSETGYIVGRDATVEARMAEGQYDRLPALAADLANKLARKLEPLRTQARTDDGDARDVASRLVEARDEAGLDWIEGCDKDNGN